MAKHFNDILTPSKGTVFVNSLDTSSENNHLEIRKNVGMFFLNPDNQIVATIVEDDVAFAPENLGVEHSELVLRVKEALKAVSMEKFAAFPPHQLSGGQTQRGAIAGIIAMRPQCIDLDEATAMLDPKGRREVMEVVRHLNREMGITVVFITHYMEEAALADRVIVMDSGNIVLDGKPKEIFKEVETLKGIGLDVPQVTYLSYLLKGTKLELPADVLTAEECADALLKRLEAIK